jgi:LL-diaminopimelate aminotransferase
LGWVVGNPELIGTLRKLKTWVDTGVFLAVQKAGAAVLDNAEALVAPLVRELTKRRDAGVRALADIGITIEPPRAAMYLWAPLPEGMTSQVFAREALEQEGVVLMPGTAFGGGGEGFFRIALTVSVERLCEAIARLGRVLARNGAAR